MPSINRESSSQGMAAMAVRAIWKGTVPFGSVNIVPFQVSIARQKANHWDIREVSRGYSGGSWQNCFQPQNLNQEPEHTWIHQREIPYLSDLEIVNSVEPELNLPA